MNNELIEKQALETIQIQDSEYILKKENEYKCSHEFRILELFSKDSEFIKSLLLSWNIPITDYYQVIGNPKSESLNYELDYLISTDNKIIISLGPNGQGGFDVYKIENNKIVEVYPYLQGKSIKWR